MDGGWWVPSGRAFFDAAVDVVNQVATAARELASARTHFYLPRKIVNPFGHCTLVDLDDYDLLVTSSRDPLDNLVSAANDYRVLQPSVVTDPNLNRSAVSFDALGIVAATALMGKQGESVGDLLQDVDANPTLATLRAFVAEPRTEAARLLGKATTRVLYDLERYRRAEQPPFAVTLARETHFFDPGGPQSKIQVSFNYSDGFAREVQKKVQAEPGFAPQRQSPTPASDLRPGALVRDPQGAVASAHTPRRWVGSGRTVFNNKGKPVRQYQPFFSATHLFETEPEMTDTGVTPVLFYDPIGRAVATLHPNHTYEKVLFEPWQQTTWDVNDTVAPRGRETGDPRTDPDVAGYVRAYFMRQPAGWETWHAQRIGGRMGPSERDAAEKAAGHADTPAVVHFEALGRSFLTVAHNRSVRNAAVVEEKTGTRIERDIEGNQRAVCDERTRPDGSLEQRIVVCYDFDMLGTPIHRSSMDAGERWILCDVNRHTVRTWDSRGFLRRMAYDVGRRPTGVYVTEGGATRLAEQTVYGEVQGEGANHRTRAYQVFDGAGIVTSVGYDFKGNLRESRRDLLPNYRDPVNWLLAPAANGGSFTSRTAFDALNRTVHAITPDGSVYRPSFNEGNLLGEVTVNMRGAAAMTPFVTNIDYDAKGQRTRVEYANGVLTGYDYDALTLRLTHLKSTRPLDANGGNSELFQDKTVVQDLQYTYDAVGNLTRVEDAALKTVFQDGEEITPAGSFTYDARYRLVIATGREHVTQTGFDFAPANAANRDYPFVGHRANPNDLRSLRNYTEQYEHDAVGNFEIHRHVAKGGNWTRRYEYDESSLVETGRVSNRLTRSTVGNGFSHSEPHDFDAHGNVTAMPHLTAMGWNYKDQLQGVDLGGGGTAFYVYDATGQRFRAVIESQNGTPRQERIYLGTYEICREYNGAGSVQLIRESLLIVDDRRAIATVETKTVVNGSRMASPVPLQRFNLSNHLGSGCLELDKNAALVSYEEYHPYGTTAFQVGRSGAETNLKRYRYTGKERDEETGFYYHGARYYPPWLGRWISCDPLGLVDGTCVYAFARNEPTNLVDDTGHQAGPWGPLIQMRRFEQAVNDLAAPIINSAPVQFASGAVDATADTVVGIGTGVRDRAIRTVHELSEHPEYAGSGVAGVVTAATVAEVRHQVTEVQAKAAEQGGGARGWFVAVNQQWNPAYGIFEHGDRTYQAAKSGDWHAAGAEATHTGIAVVSTVVAVEGGAAVAEGALARAEGALAREAGPRRTAPRAATPSEPPAAAPAMTTPTAPTPAAPKVSTPGAPPPGAPAPPPGGPRIHSRYADQTPVLEGQQPPRIAGPDPAAQGPHSVLRHDPVNSRTYQGREFDASGNPVRDVDFTNPTFPSGRMRPNHPGPPHQHRFIVNDPAVGPRSGFKRGGPEPIQ